MIVVGVMAAGACGAVLRYLVDHGVQRRTGGEFPFGTLVINVSGSFVLGILTGAALHDGVSATWLTVAGTGLIGAYTTFSTFSFDNFRLLTGDAAGTALTNMVLSVVAGLAAAAAGLALGGLV